MAKLYYTEEGYPYWAEGEEDKELQSLLDEQAGVITLPPVEVTPQPLTALQPDEIPITPPPQPTPIAPPEPEPPPPLPEPVPPAPSESVDEQLEQLLPEPEPLPEELQAPPPEPLGLVELPEEEPVSPFNATQFVEKVVTDTRQAMRRAAGEVLGGAAALPWMVGAAPFALGTAAERILAPTGPTAPISARRVGGFKTVNIGEPSNAEGAYSWLVDQAASTSENVKALLGVAGPPESPVEQVAQWAGQSLTPIKGYTLPVTAATTGVRAGLEWLVGPAEAGEAEDRAVALERLRRGEGARPTAAPSRVTPGLRPGQAPTTPLIHTGPAEKKPSTYGLKKRKGETDEEFARRVDAERVKREKAKQVLTPTAKSFVDTVGGPREIKDSELWIMGGMAAATIGMMWGPKVIQRWKRQQVPGPRPVTDALPGTESVTRPGHMVTVSHDANTAAVRIVSDGGFIPGAAEKLQTVFRIQTKAGGEALIDSAVGTGQFRTPTYSFRAPASLVQLDKMLKATPYAKEYIITQDIAEQLNIMEQQRKFQIATAASVSPGRPVVQGMQMPDALRQLKAYEQMNPEVVNVAKAWAGWNKARRTFEKTGEHATIPNKNPNVANPAAENSSFEWQNRMRPYETPWYIRRPDGAIDFKRDIGMSFDERVARTDLIKGQEHYSRIAMRHRMTNEANGMLIEETSKNTGAIFNELKDVRRSDGTIYTVQQQRADNPRWEKNTITTYRRGVPEHHTADPTLVDLMKMDTYAPLTIVGDALYSMKRMFQAGTTGMLEPMFAFTNALRTWHNAKSTALPGRWHPSVYGMGKGVTQQLYPQISRFIAQQMEWGSGGRLSEFFGGAAGKQWADGLAKRLAPIYDKSLYAEVERMGGSRGSAFVNHEARSQAIAAADRMFQKATGPLAPYAKGVWEGWKSFWGSIHESPQFAYISANRGKAPLEQLILESRDLAGDPRIGGQYLVRDRPGGARTRPIRFQPGTIGENIDAAILKHTFGIAGEAGRHVVPWFAAIQQGISAVGKAWMRDPVRFTRDTWLYTILPAGAIYYYNESLGKDPNGRKYSEYSAVGRTDNDAQMLWYFGIPGLPVEQGVKIPAIGQENSLAKRLTEVALDHAMGTSRFSEGQDFAKAVKSWLDVTINIPTHPAIGVYEALHGKIAPMNIFGEPFTKKEDPFNQNAGMPGSLELFLRALGGAISQTVGAGVAAYTHTPKGFLDGVGNAFSEAGKVWVGKVPLVRNVTGLEQPLSGTNRVTEELFKKQKHLDQLMRFYLQEDIGAGKINVKGASGGGEYTSGLLMGPPIATEIPGLVQPPPDNPLYLSFMSMMYDRFRKESPNAVKGVDEGGIGFKSMWRRYGDATRALQTLKDIDDGNHATWQMQLATRPLAKQELENHGVDPTDIRRVRNYYQMKRQDAARVLLNAMQYVEEEMSKKAGKPVRIEDIKPYGKPLAPAQFMFPELLQGMWGTEPS